MVRDGKTYFYIWGWDQMNMVAVEKCELREGEIKDAIKTQPQRP